MVPKSVIDRTRERFRQRAPERGQHEAALAQGSPLTADTPVRVEKRLVRLAVNTAERGTVPGAVSTGGASVGLLERILGKNDLMSVSFLDAALIASRTVARVRIRSGSQTIGYGSGSLVGPGLLLTNNHVLETAAQAATSLAEFNYQDGVATPSVFDLEPERFFITDPTLDYTLVAVRELGGDQVALATLGFNRLIEQEGKVLLGEALNIIQHPNGELKQLALRENTLKDILPQFLHYQTDTAPGSSGSPVFNDQWELVALHHSGVPQTDDQGRYLTVDGTVWEPAMGEHRIAWIANEGARVSQIIAHLKNQVLNATARALRDAALSGESAPVLAPAPRSLWTPAATGASGVRVQGDGTATWTIPIQVSVQIGGQAAPPVPPALAAPAPVPSLAPLLTAPPTDLQSALALVDTERARPYYNEAEDLAARDAYYAAIDVNAGRAAVFDALSDLLTRTHTPKPAYKPATHVYPFVDLHPDRKLRSIYSQKAFEPEELIRRDFEIEQERGRRLQETLRSEAALSAERISREAAAIEAALPFNCEHVVPQSWFDKDEPMRGDIHHLFACEPQCNSFRSNIPYFDFPDFEEVIRDECGKREADRFEPSAAKGIVARATLYFLLRYPGTINNIVDVYDTARLATLLSWHGSHPVTKYEKHRNMAICEKQGNRNPLIDHPEWADRIDFAKGL